MTQWFRFEKSIDLDWLRSRVSYDPDTGKMVWIRCTQSWRNGQECGYIDKFGYRVTNFGARPLPVHRLAWFYVHGTWPRGLIDHINGNRADNRFCNLREATVQQNAHNRAAAGFTRVAKVGKWQAQIKVAGRNQYLGLFDTAEEARAAYMAKAKETRGKFARAG